MASSLTTVPSAKVMRSRQKPSLRGVMLVFRAIRGNVYKEIWDICVGVNMLIKFGFLDSRDAVASENFHIYPDENIDNNQVRGQTDGGWYVAKSLRTRRFSVPLNYYLEGDFISEEHARFCVWGLSFAYGVRLGTSKNEFIDALCIDTSSLGFLVYGDNLTNVMNIIYKKYTGEKKFC